MQVKRYQSSDKVEWDDFVDRAKNPHFMHKRDYMEYHADRFTDHSLIFMEGDEWLGVLPANEKDHVLYSHQGLTFGGLVQAETLRMKEALDIFVALGAYTKENGLQKLVYKAMPAFYHRIPSEEDIYGLFRQDARLIRVDVTTTIDCRERMSFSTLRQRGAKKALKAGVSVRKTDDYESFHAIIDAIVREKYDTAPTHSREEMKLLASRFPDNIHLHGAYLENQMVAGVLIFETATAAHAQYIGANEQGRETGALDLLFSSLINETYTKKRWFDFGISTEQGGRHLNENLIAQKEGFGGRGMAHLFYELDF